MDPISIVALTGASASIIKTCASAVVKLREIRQRWKSAPALLDSIVHQCDTIQATMTLIREWLVSSSRETINDETFKRALLSTLEYCLEVLQGLEQSTVEYTSSWGRFKLLVNETSLRQSLEELRWHAHATHNLWVTFKLAAPKRRRQVQQIQTSLQVHSSQTNVANSSRASILSVDSADDEHDSRTTLAGASRGVSRFGIVGAKKKTQKVTDIPGHFPSEPELDTRTADSHAQNLNRSSRTEFPSCSILQPLVLVSALLVAVLILNTALTSIIELIEPAPTPTKSFRSEALLTAAAAGSWKNTSKLLKEGAKPSTRNSKLQTPLHLAAANGSLETIKLLLEQKDTGWYADDNVTPLHMAARYGHTDAVKLIIEIPGHDWHRERATAPEAIQKLKNATGNRFDQQFANFFKKKTFTARELALTYSHIDTALSFPSSRNDDIRAALSCACILGDMHMVEEIMKHHNNRSHLQKHWWMKSRVRWFPAPPLHLAVMSGDSATVSFLLEQGWKANVQSWRSILNWSTDVSPLYSSPAHYAAMNGSRELLKALSRRGADADLTNLDHKSRTPLSYAVQTANEAAVKLLVEQKHPRRGPILGWCFFAKCVSRTYLGPGHEWQDRRLKAAAIPNIPIKRALQDVGFDF